MKTKKLKRAVIYLRVSSDKQVNTDIDPEGLSLPSQRKRCEAHAASLGAEVVREYVEPGISGGSVLKRKAFRTMLADIEVKDDVDVVIVWKVSRWARNERDLWVAHSVLQDHGVELASVSEPIDSSPTGMLILGVMGAIGAHESRQLSVEVTRGLTQKVEVGGTPGLAPLGYRNTTVEIEGRQIRGVVIDEKRGPWIELAFRLYATGDYSLSELAAILDDLGLRSRATKRVPEQAVRMTYLAKILRNPYYMGIVRYAGKSYPGRHEPLVDEGRFLEVQDLLTAKRQSGERAWRYFHHLRGSVYCGECGGRLIYQRPKGNGGTYEYFSCAGRSKRNCSQGYHRAVAVEVAIERHYAVVQLSDERRESIRRAIRTHVEGVAKVADRQIAEAKADLSRLEAEERKLLRAHYADQISESLYVEEQERIQRGRVGCERRIAELSVEHERVLDALDTALALTKNMQAAYRQARPQQRRLFNQAFFERLEILVEDVVGSQIADPFAQLSGQPPRAEDDTALTDRLGPGWDETYCAIENGLPEPSAGTSDAKTSDLFFEDGGSHVESLVRLKGVEPSRALAHTDLNRARLPVPPQPRGQPIYRLRPSKPVPPHKATRIHPSLESRTLAAIV